LIKLQGSDEFDMNFERSDLNLDLNINHWKLRKPTAYIGLNLAGPKANWAWLQNAEQGRKLGGWGNHFG
jgi:hypothetical protein